MLSDVRSWDRVSRVSNITNLWAKKTKFKPKKEASSDFDLSHYELLRLLEFHQPFREVPLSKPTRVNVRSSTYNCSIGFALDDSTGFAFWIFRRLFRLST